MQTQVVPVLGCAINGKQTCCSIGQDPDAAVRCVALLEICTFQTVQASYSICLKPHPPYPTQEPFFPLPFDTSGRLLWQVSVSEIDRTLPAYVALWQIVD